MRIATIVSGVVTNVSEGDTGIPCGDANVGWLYNGITFSPPTSILDQAKEAKMVSIERTRNVACVANVIVHGRSWQADSKSQNLIANEILTTQAGVPMSPVWRDATNSNMPLTDIQQLIDIAAAIKAQTNAAYAASWVRKAAVEAAATIEAVNAI